MVIQNLKLVLEKNAELVNKAFIRNALKEELQAFVLNFVYTSSYKNLIFTGGTALRRFYGLPRISEDLDFDIEGKVFDFEGFLDDLKKYFEQEIGYKNLEIKLKGKTLFLRFPVLEEIGFSAENETDILFLRVDFAFIPKGKKYKTVFQLFSGGDFSFLVKTYDFTTLFENKVTAFLTREFRKGGTQEESFKGRDAFDLVWMLQEAKRLNIRLKLDEETKNRVLKKAEKIKPGDLFNDLNSFFADLSFVHKFCDNYYELVSSNLSKNHST